MRENYLHVLPEIQEILGDNDDCTRIVIDKDGCVLERSNGSKQFFDFTQPMCRAEQELVMDGDPEKEEMNLVSEFLSLAGVKTVFDIGANMGLYSLHLYQKHREPVYYLFEPVPGTFKWLKKMEKLNEVDPEHFKSFNQGLSNTKGKITFYVPASHSAASMVANEDQFYRKRSTSSGEYTGETNVEEVACDVTTVDDFVREHGVENIGFMKIDVEGNEKAVLEGAKESLKRFCPLVYAELLRKHAKRFGYHPDDVIRYMSELGYRCVTMEAGRLKDVEAITEETVQTNFFFLHHTMHKMLYDRFI